jgi:hypothetical protein
MRWNVVIGGQTFSKSLRGFRESEAPGLFEKEGIALAIVIFVLPLLFIALFNRILPVFERPGDEPADAAEAGAR